jgi:cytidylate kinase
VKLFVTARPEVRAQRRFAELKARGLEVHFADVLADIKARDERDTGRAAAPLTMAAGAVPIDTSDMDVPAAIAAAISAVARIRS